MLLLVPSTRHGRHASAPGGALSAHDANFGRVLGRLYGWNTLGAFLGTLRGDLVLIEAVGIRGTALAAAGLNLLAAGGAALLAPRFGEPPRANAALEARPLGWAAARILAAAFLAGATLLALEVVWFRFLLSFTPSSAWTFAAMLAVVLLGIAAGGIAAGELLGGRRRRAPLRRRGRPAGRFAVVLSYVSFLRWSRRWEPTCWTRSRGISDSPCLSCSPSASFPARSSPCSAVASRRSSGTRRAPRGC